MAFYNLKDINSIGAQYNFLLGGRGVGKTYAVIKQAIEHYFKTGEPFAYVRRYKESIAPSKLSSLLKPHYGLIEMLSDGQYNCAKVWQQKIWLEYRDEEGERVRKDPNPICHLISLNTQDADKGEDKGFVKYIIFDEVIARNGYLRDEWAIFTNCLSSLIRHRAGTIIYMLANPISKFCLYFDELGIDFNSAKQGHLYVIKYDDEGKSKCAFEWIADNLDGSSTVADEYFAFKNDKVKSITDGSWEFDEVQHLPPGYYMISEEKKKFYFCFTGKVFCCELRKYEKTYFLFFRPAKEVPKKSYYFTLERKFDKYAIIGCDKEHPVYQLINRFYKTGQVYYSDNTTGDYILGYRAAANNLKI